MDLVVPWCYGGYGGVTEVTEGLRRLRRCYGGYGGVTEVTEVLRRLRGFRRSKQRERCIGLVWEANRVSSRRWFGGWI